MTALATRKKRNPVHNFFYKRKRTWQLYVLALLPLIHLFIFSYGPMYGLQIAFRNFNPIEGIWGSPWVGLDHFVRFVNLHMFRRVLVNTLAISIYGLLAGFPFPILLAFSIHYLRSKRFSKIVQTTTFMPHLISVVVFVGIITQFFSLRTGVINNLLIEPLTGDRINFLGRAQYFRHIFVWTGVWQSAGFGAIIYLAGLAGVDPSLHEAATIDGASKVQRMWHVDVPSILPTITILFILQMGNIISVGFERIFLLQNPMNLSVSEVISTYVYKVGLIAPIPQFSFAASIGLFNSVVNAIMLVIANQVARRVGDTSLW
ncbi:MAG: ABC transporter permease subunit [Defluviitaleaceae bacterium]|nr:ABC transporter permease subunit [Defluviitaleaceae bacterium]